SAARSAARRSSRLASPSAYCSAATTARLLPWPSRPQTRRQTAAPNNLAFRRVSRPVAWRCRSIAARSAEAAHSCSSTASSPLAQHEVDSPTAAGVLTGLAAVAQEVLLRGARILQSVSQHWEPGEGILCVDCCGQLDHHSVIPAEHCGGDRNSSERG